MKWVGILGLAGALLLWAVPSGIWDEERPIMYRTPEPVSPIVVPGLPSRLFTIRGVPSPKGAEFSPDGKEIWVASLMNTRSGVFVADATSGEIVNRIALPGGGAVELIFSRDGDKVYVSQMETGRVFEIEVSSKSINRVFGTGGNWTKMMVLSPDGRDLYASNWTSNNVSVIDLETGKMKKLIPTVSTPRGLYISPDGEWLYVAGFDQGELQKINLLTGESGVIYQSGGALRHFAVDDQAGRLFISDMGKNEILVLNLATGVVSKFAEAEVNPNTIVLSPDRKMLFVSNRGRNFSATNYYVPGPEWGSVLVFDVTTGGLLDAIVGGNQSTALAISPDGRHLVSSNFLDASLDVYFVPSYESLKATAGGRSATYKKDLIK